MIPERRKLFGQWAHTSVIKTIISKVAAETRRLGTEKMSFRAKLNSSVVMVLSSSVVHL